MKVNLIKAKMLENNVRMRDLANYLDINYVSLSNRFTGSVKFSLEDARRTREILHLSDSEF